MNLRPLLRVCLCAAMAVATATSSAAGAHEAPAPLAELVAMRTSDGVLLHGLHYRPEQPSATVVIHVPGGPGAFYSIQDMAPVAAELTENGYHFLSVNTRTAGANGMMYARFEDYRLDLEAAVQLALVRGMTGIVLLGQSLGTARAVHYQSATEQPAVEALVLTAPIPSPYLEAQARWNEAERAAYDAFLEEQRAAVAADEGRRLASYAWWGNDRILEVSAATWVNLFGPPAESDASTVEFAPDIELPVLVVYGTKDETVSPELAAEVLAAFTSAPLRDLRAVEGANHVFIGFEAQLADVVTGWLLEHVPPRQPGGEEDSSQPAAEAN